MVSVTRLAMSNFSYVFLTPRNIPDFVDMSKPPPGYFKVHLAGQSDWIRVCLLEKYGGFYVDSTTYVTCGDGVEWVFSEALKAKRSVFGFAKQGIKCFVEMSVVGASVNSTFMKAYKSDYAAVLEANNMAQYVKDTCAELKKDNRFGVEVECGSEYFLVHHIFLKTCYANQSLGDDLLILPSHFGQFLLILECDMKAACVIDRLQYDSHARAYPFIKVTSAVRNGRKFHMKEDGYRPEVARVEKDKSARWSRITEELDYWATEIAYRLESLQSALKEAKIGREVLHSSLKGGF